MHDRRGGLYHPLVGYVVAVVIPLVATIVVALLRLPAFVFEHLIVLLVLAVAIPWGLAPAMVTALTAVVADDVVLREPFGRPTVSGPRDVADLLLFAVVALVVSSLVRRAQESRVAARQAAERERRAREDRERLVATVTHDLATPLAVLSSTVEFARRGGLASGVDVSRLLDRLDAACLRATSLVRTLAEARGLEQGGLDLRIQPVDITAALTRVVLMMDRLSDRHPVTLSAPREPVVIDADGERLDRVFENLIGNAIKYTPDGGLVEVRLVQDAEDAVITVRDRGIGIAADALAHIFEPTYRAPEAAASTPGLGLGLSIALQIVQGHGGCIDARAAEGGGTCVAVRLPLSTASDAPRGVT